MALFNKILEWIKNLFKSKETPLVGDNVTVTNITSTTGTTSANTLNTNINKLANEFDKVIYKDGREDMTAALNMGSNRIINLAPGIAGTDAVNLNQLLSGIGFAYDGSEILLATSRAVMAAMTGMTDGQPLYLSEGNRKGIFIWRSASQAAGVTADPQQGIYVPLTSNTSGSAGAWVRDYSDGDVNVFWFGADPTNTTDSAPAFKAAQTLLRARAGVRGANIYNTTGSTYWAIGRVIVPVGVFKIGSTIVCADGQIIWQGLSSGMAGGDASILKMSVDATAFQFWKAGDSRYLSGAGTGNADGSMIIGLCIEGTNDRFNNKADLGTNNPGVFAGTRIIMRDFIISNFSGNGLTVDADAGLSHGNANSWQIKNGRIMANGGHGVFTQGGDVNAASVENVDCNYNGRMGFYNDTFLCIKYDSCHTSDNGYSDVYPSMAFYNLAIWQVKEGQEVAAKTTAPVEGTVWTKVADWRIGIDYTDPTDTSNWGRRTWVSGTRDYFFAACYYNKGPNGQSTWINCYSEGRQPAAWFNSRSTIIGGTYSTPPFGTGATLEGQLGVMLSNKGFYAQSVPNGWGVQLGGEFSNYTILGSFYPSASQRMVYDPVIGGITWTGNAEVASYELGPLSVMTFGRSTAQTGYFWGRRFALGSVTGEARVMDYGSSIPGVYHAAGELLFNPAPALGGNVGKICTVAGNTGTWQNFGIVGGTQAAHQADSVAATVAAMVTDFNALLAKLQAAKLMA